ncbi:MAG: mechanosensitive ion channel family protein [Planctomycetota bacterium]|nr:MAG: mechanosensitive ion channel family protein [Planctomycetota bacterium]REJ97115.1 MAG: mechanosensitive ion channel family protein [Planctomycetota bacterium]
MMLRTLGHGLFSLFFVLAGWLLPAATTTTALLWLTPVVAVAEDEPEPDADSAESSGDEDADGSSQSSSEAPRLDSPRAVMQTFLLAYHDSDFDRAAACLDFSKMVPPPDDVARFAAVEQLKGIMDRLERVVYEEIPENYPGLVYRWPAEQDNQPIAIERGDDGQWRFGAEMVASLDALWEVWQDKPVVLPWYRQVFLGTELWKFGTHFFALLIAWIVGRIVKSMLLSTGASLERRNSVYVAATLTALARAVIPLALVVGFSIGMQFLRLNATVREIVETVVAVLYALSIAYALYCLVDVVATWLDNMAQKTDSKLDDMLAPMVTTTARCTIVVLALVQVATILSDKPMTSVLAGLGVGGLAIGLAAQDMIKNFFGSLMIFGDQPFQLGDRIVVDSVDGSVEMVGFRSTRIRTLDGHLVTFPNGDLANSPIRNIAARPNIKRSFSVTVTYDTPPEKVQRATEILGEILHEHEGMDPDVPPRVYFNDMTDTALSIMVIYWYHPADYWAYCAFSQWVNFEILHRFNHEGIEFAFPTQTLFLAGDPNRPLNTAAD